MSRKKYPHSDDSFGGRLRKIREDNKLTATSLSKILGISQSFLSDAENNKRPLKSDALTKLKNYLNVDINWLLTGGVGAENTDPPGGEETTIYKDGAGDLPGDPFHQPLRMAREILSSHTDYAVALAANIRSFHKSVELEKRTSTLEEKCDELIEEVKGLKEKVSPDRRDRAPEGEEVAALTEAADRKQVSPEG